MGACFSQTAAGLAIDILDEMKLPEEFLAKLRGRVAYGGFNECDAWRLTYAKNNLVTNISSTFVPEVYVRTYFTRKIIDFLKTKSTDYLKVNTNQKKYIASKLQYDFVAWVLCENPVQVTYGEFIQTGSMPIHDVRNAKAFAQIIKGTHGEIQIDYETEDPTLVDELNRRFIMSIIHRLGTFNINVHLESIFRSVRMHPD
jgi:hypothetical protein